MPNNTENTDTQKNRYAFDPALSPRAIISRRELCAALRSGAYKQAKTSYYTELDGEGRYCALGIARRMAAQKLHPDRDPDVIAARLFDSDYCVAGVSSKELIAQNDGGLNFNQIADWIERQPWPYEPKWDSYETKMFSSEKREWVNSAEYSRSCAW